MERLGSGEHVASQQRPVEAGEVVGGGDESGGTVEVERGIGVETVDVTPVLVGAATLPEGTGSSDSR